MFLPVALVLSFASLTYALLDLQLIRGLRRLKRANASESGETPSITILIAARDEEKNLPRVLSALLAQDYPAEKFQILVINDRSEDGTESVLRRYAETNPARVAYLNVGEVPHGISPKKNALLKGLEIARGEWIAVTDADCVMGPRWLSTLSRQFHDDTGMVLGFTSYDEPGDGFGMSHGIQALEFVSHAIVSAALVSLDFPVNANANNLAYRRKAFDEASAFKKHGHIVSGDDDFVLQEIHATGRWVIHFCTGPEALMRTALPDSWNHFWEQHKRWASKCGFYRPRQVVFLAAVFVFYAAIPVLLLAGFQNPRWAWLGLAIFAVKTLADFAVMRTGLGIFGLSRLLRAFPLTALLHVPLLLAAVIAGSWGGFTWKGQRMSSRA